MGLSYFSQANIVLITTLESSPQDGHVVVLTWDIIRIITASSVDGEGRSMRGHFGATRTTLRANFDSSCAAMAQLLRKGAPVSLTGLQFALGDHEERGAWICS